MLGGVRSIKGEKQMIYKNITFKAAPFSYDLTFDDRITLVGGDSGTGKTVLYEMLEDIRLTDEYKAINPLCFLVLTTTEKKDSPHNKCQKKHCRFEN